MQELKTVQDNFWQPKRTIMKSSWTLLGYNGLSSAALIYTIILFIFQTAYGQIYTSTSLPQEVPTRYTIGAALRPSENIVKFIEYVEATNNKARVLSFDASTITMDSNPIRTAKRVCETLVKSQVYAVIVGQPEDDDLSVASVSYTCGFYNIPVVGIRSRDSAFSDKNVHPSFIRTVPPYSFQADMWIQLLKYLKYEKVIFIHSSDTDGRAAYTRFVNGIDDTKIKIEAYLEYEAGETDLEYRLASIFDSVSSRVILVYASAKDAEEIFRNAKDSNSPGYVWFITEQALQAPNVPDGVLGLELPNASNAIAHIHDAVEVISRAIKKMYNNDYEEIITAPASCNGSAEAWFTGKRLVSYIKQDTYLGGMTGKLGFDENGDRMFAEYNVINVVNGNRQRVGNFSYSTGNGGMKLVLLTDKIVWPGNEVEKPLGYHVPTHLRVVTLTERPFVYASPVLGTEDKCDSMIPCTKYNKLTGAKDDYCCSGYCMELLRKLSERLNFTYEVYLEQDNIYGMPVKVNGTSEKQWTGLIAELLDGNADMAVAALTITPERSQVIDFSKPFKYQGITILEKMQHKSSLLSSFLQPFQTELWILVMVSVHVVALALYLLDRFSPFGRYKLPNSDATEEDALNLSSAIWFAWGVLLNSGIGEGTPRSFSARVLGMVWAGFAMIVVASYTANLAAFLVLDRPDTRLSGINDARLRNPVENFTYATVAKSSVDMYFQKQVELSNMYRTMEGRNYHTVEDAVQAVKKDDLNAFIWDSARLDYEAAQDCSLQTSGELFGRSGIGVGFVKNSYWSEPTTLAILEMHENGFMEELDKDWIYATDKRCGKQEKGPVTLGLKNMGGVFILVGAGIVGGIGLIIIEIIYKRHQTSKQKKMELARHAADKWRGAIEKRKVLRASIENQKRLKTNGMEILACGSLDKQYNALPPESIPTSASHFSSFRPLPSPEIRLRNQHHGTSSGSGIRPIYKSQDFVV